MHPSSIQLALLLFLSISFTESSSPFVLFASTGLNDLYLLIKEQKREMVTQKTLLSLYENPELIVSRVTRTEKSGNNVVEDTNSIFLENRGECTELVNKMAKSLYEYPELIVSRVTRTKTPGNNVVEDTNSIFLENRVECTEPVNKMAKTEVSLSRPRKAHEKTNEIYTYTSPRNAAQRPNHELEWENVEPPKTPDYVRRSGSVPHEEYEQDNELQLRNYASRVDKHAAQISLNSPGCVKADKLRTDTTTTQNYTYKSVTMGSPSIVAHDVASSSSGSVSVTPDRESGSGVRSPDCVIIGSKKNSLMVPDLRRQSDTNVLSTGFRATNSLIRAESKQSTHNAHKNTASSMHTKEQPLRKNARKQRNAEAGFLKGTELELEMRKPPKTPEYIGSSSNGSTRLDEYEEALTPEFQSGSPLLRRSNLKFFNFSDNGKVRKDADTVTESVAKVSKKTADVTETENGIRAPLTPGEPNTKIAHSNRRVSRKQTNLGRMNPPKTPDYMSTQESLSLEDDEGMFPNFLDGSEVINDPSWRLELRYADPLGLNLDTTLFSDSNNNVESCYGAATSIC